MVRPWFGEVVLAPTYLPALYTQYQITKSDKNHISEPCLFELLTNIRHEQLVLLLGKYGGFCYVLYVLHRLLGYLNEFWFGMCNITSKLLNIPLSFLCMQASKQARPSTHQSPIGINPTQSNSLTTLSRPRWHLRSRSPLFLLSASPPQPITQLISPYYRYTNYVRKISQQTSKHLEKSKAVS